MSEPIMDKLVSPHSFDGDGPVPGDIVAAAKRIAELRVKFLSQWTPGMENPLTTREVEELFVLTALRAEWERELLEARDALRQENERLRERLELLERQRDAAEALARQLTNDLCDVGQANERLRAALREIDALERDSATGDL